MLLLLLSYPSLLWAACTTLLCDSYDINYNASGVLVNGAHYGPNNLSLAYGPLTMVNASIDKNFYWSAPASLHVTCPKNGSGAGTVFSQNAASGTGWPQIFGRAMVYYSNASGATLPTSVHSWIFSASGSNSYYATHNDSLTNKSSGGVSMNIIVGHPNVQLNYHWSTTGAEANVGSLSNQTVPINKWFCLQWHYDGPNSGAKVWVDGSLFINVTHNNSFDQYVPNGGQNWRFPNQPGWTTLQFGYNHYQNFANPVDVHLDDFQLDTQMTCCPCATGVMLPYCCAAFVPPTSAPSVPPTPGPTTLGQTPSPTLNGTTKAPSSPTNMNGGSALAASILLMMSLMMIVF